MSSKIPDEPGEMLKVFRKLCEEYADEADSGMGDVLGNIPHLTGGPHEDNLLQFCHAYAYKMNGVKSW